MPKWIKLLAVAGLCAVPACDLTGEEVSSERCVNVRAEIEELDAVADAAQANPNWTAEDEARLREDERTAALAWATCDGLDNPTTTTTVPTTSTTSTSTTQPPPPQGNLGLPFDPDTYPATFQGLNAPRIVTTGFVPTPGDAAFRTNCGTALISQSDPLGNPGFSNGHLHTFWGNQSVSPFSTTMDTGSSTCDGGTANRTGYWMPSLIDVRDSSVPTTWNPLEGLPPGPEGHRAMQVYYKRGYQGVDIGEITRWFPVGLRILVGDSTRTGPTCGTASIHFCNPPIGYACTGTFAQVVNPTSESIPSCDVGQVLQTIVRFPQCWDGVNLDSSDHRSHMAYSRPFGTADPGCPASHPVPLPEITMHERMIITEQNEGRYWARSSDTYLAGQPGPFTTAGYSVHADWWNGWDPAIGQLVVDNCLRVERDCQFSLGDGRELWQ